MKRGLHHTLGALALAALAAGCGGGGGSSAPAPVVVLPLAGSLDPAFGAAGEFRPQAEPFDSDGLRVLATDDAGNVYAAGNSTRGDFLVVKLDAAGRPDPTFGAEGRVYVDVDGGSVDTVAGMAIDAVGKLYVAGTAMQGTDRGRFAVVKLEADGRLAADFGVGGRALVADAGHFLEASALLRDAQGNLYVTGTRTPSGGVPAFAVAKLTAAGMPVASFGTAGLRTIAFEQAGGARANLGAAARDAQGHLYIGGVAYPDPAAGLVFDRWIAIAKLDAAGNLVPGYAAGGRFALPMCGSGGAAALAVGRNDDLYVATNASCGKFNTVDTMVKLDRDGRLVSSFGTGGIAYEVFGNGLAEQEEVNAVVATPDGIFIAGNAAFPSTCPVLTVARLDENGRLVPGFGSNGVFRGQRQGDRGDRAVAMAFDPHGRLLVGGDSAPTCPQRKPPGGREFLLVRLR